MSTKLFLGRHEALGHRRPLKLTWWFFQLLQLAIPLYPGMLQDALNGDPIRGLNLKNLVQQVLDLFRDSAAELHSSVHDIVIDLLDLLGPIR